MKYVNTAIVFSEVPDEITLAINISGCTIRCKDCHSKHLWENIGNELTSNAVDTLIKKNQGISCICFMGGKFSDLKYIFDYIKSNYNLKTAWYTGENEIPKDNCVLDLLDFIKVGPYIKEKGGLDSPATNQRMYKILKDQFGRTIYSDITYKFRK